MDKISKKLMWIPGAALIAIAATIWGTDELLRGPLVDFKGAAPLSPETIVFSEHLFLVVAMLPFLNRSFRSARKNLDPVDWISVIMVGAGASAVAGILFTNALGKSFALGDNGVSVFLLQKIQPFVAVTGAAILLRERLHERFWAFFVAGIFFAYVLSFGFTTAPRVKNAEVTALACGAAILWGLGTVLGRSLSLKLKFEEVATLRFFFGLLACTVMLYTSGSPAFAPIGDYWRLAGMGLITGGLIALLLYYIGLQRTPASIATLAELALPVTIAVVGALFIDGRNLTGAQWFGAIGLTATVTLLGILSSRGSKKLGVELPSNTPEAQAA